MTSQALELLLRDHGWEPIGSGLLESKSEQGEPELPGAGVPAARQVELAL